MSTLTIPITQGPRSWALPDRGKVGMAGLIIAESGIFTIFVVAFFFYAGKSLSGPTPGITAHLAAKCLQRGEPGAFLRLWLLTLILGGLFLFGTAREWLRLICDHGLTISTNLFGTTYYSLVGLHAFHITVGLFMLLIALAFGLAGRVNPDQSGRIGVLSMYWHFVDTVWVVVFTIVYILGR